MIKESKEKIIELARNLSENRHYFSNKNSWITMNGGSIMISALEQFMNTTPEHFYNLIKSRVEKHNENITRMSR